MVWLHATAKGARLLHAGRQRRVAALEADLARLAPAERDTLADAAAILERVLHDPGGTDAVDRPGGTSRADRTGRMGGTGRKGWIR